MTAKPQQTDQSNSADDLIAELARLMAQDAGTEKPPERPAFALRIPGEPAAPAPSSSIPAPRFDFGAANPERVAQPAPAVEQSASASSPVAAEPFSFDRGAQPKSQLAAAPEVPPTEDAIAQLIEAEFANAHPEPQQPAAEEAVAPQPVVPVVAEPAPVRAADPVQDQFRIPPVFGLGGASKAQAAVPDVDRPRREEPPAASQARPAMDPIDEIESLIGRAVQVGLEQPARQQQEQPVEPVVDFVPAPAPEPEARPAASPTLRSLATPTLKPPPQPAARSNLSAADETVMAAAQATGAQLAWVDEPEVEEPVARRPERRRPRLVLSRALAGPAVAVTLLLAAGFGLYWVLGVGTPEGPAPLLTASADPVKKLPEVSAETSAPQQSVVFNEMAGGAPEQEQLVSRDQADVTDVVAATTLPEATDSSANRKVRTVTVRPDGTIVSGEDSLAGGTILPVARPNVPDVPGATDASPLLASTGAASDIAAPEAAADTPALPAEAEAAIAETAATPAVPPVEPGTYVAAVDVSGNPIPGKTAPVPMVKPQFSTAALAAAAQALSPQTPANALVAPAATQQASLPPPVAGTPAPAPAASAGEAAAYVQLSSQRTEDAARASAQEIVNRFGPLFGGANLEVQRVDLGERGIFYRVRAPAASLSDANTLCSNIKAAGGDCFTM